MHPRAFPRPCSRISLQLIWRCRTSPGQVGVEVSCHAGKRDREILILYYIILYSHHHFSWSHCAVFRQWNPRAEELGTHGNQLSGGRAGAGRGCLTSTLRGTSRHGMDLQRPIFFWGDEVRHGLIGDAWTSTLNGFSLVVVPCCARLRSSKNVILTTGTNQPETR